MNIIITEFLSNLFPIYIKYIFEAITMLAEQYTVVVIACMIYWCINKDLGRRLSLILSGGIGFNGFFKNVFRVPRPFDISDKVSVLRKSTATGYSFPSGHTQNASVLAGILKNKFTRKSIRAVIITYAFLVAFSRLVLGVHYLTDVIAALIIGFGWAYFGNKLYEAVKENTFKYLWFLVPAFLSIIPLFIKGTIPPQSNDVFTGVGISLGAVLGTMLEVKYISFTIEGSIKRRIIRFVLGILLLLLLLSGLKAVLPDTSAMRVLRYFCVGIFASCGMPFLIKKFSI
ncbi:MAG: phosphatase PAP2 family protein [Bacillota bacterium]|nr:phosphatase PAP2 family protein [Bacillota bacterium]